MSVVTNISLSIDVSRFESCVINFCSLGYSFVFVCQNSVQILYCFTCFYICMTYIIFALARALATHTMMLDQPTPTVCNVSQLFNAVKCTLHRINTKLKNVHYIVVKRLCLTVIPFVKDVHNVQIKTNYQQV